MCDGWLNGGACGSAHFPLVPSLTSRIFGAAAAPPLQPSTTPKDQISRSQAASHCPHRVRVSLGVVSVHSPAVEVHAPRAVGRAGRGRPVATSGRATACRHFHVRASRARCLVERCWHSRPRPRNFVVHNTLQLFDTRQPPIAMSGKTRRCVQCRQKVRKCRSIGDIRVTIRRSRHMCMCCPCRESRSSRLSSPTSVPSHCP